MMKKTLPFALVLVAGLGLAACDKKEEEKSQAPVAPATEAQPAAPTAEPPLPETNEPMPQDDMPDTDEPGANAPLSSPEGQPEQNQ
jgi:hypothetical protein